MSQIEFRIDVIDTLLAAAKQASKEGRGQLASNHLAFAKELHDINVAAIELEGVYRKESN